MRGLRAEELVAKLFQALGYQVERQVALSGVRLDMVATKNGTSIPVEVVALTGHGNILSKLRSDAARLQSVFSLRIPERPQSRCLVPSHRLRRSGRNLNSA